MKSKLYQIFKKENNIVIGMVHFPPLFGYKDFPGIDVCLKKVLQDAKTLKRGGVDGLMVENNYDIPHKTFVGQGTVDMMITLTKAIVKKISIPIGISVLWNDYKAALTIAKKCGGKFIRVPVFVDSVRTQYGEILAEPEKVLAFRKEKGSSDIALFTDIHVKHAEMLKDRTISESAKEAVEKGSDALIITGKWTGDMPNIQELKEARKTAGKDFPIFVGSGTTKENAATLLRYANGTIVGTSLKTGRAQNKEKEVNLKPWQENISLKKTKEFMEVINNIDN